LVAPVPLVHFQRSEIQPVEAPVTVAGEAAR
jgi:hypothetical protein